MKLARFEQRWARTIGDAIVGDPREALGGVRAEIDLGAALGEEVQLATPATAAVLRLALWLAWLAPLWRRGRLDSFGALSAPEREALLDDLMDSRSYAVRELLMLLKLFVCLRLLGEPRALGHIGAYDLGAGPVRLRPPAAQRDRERPAPGDGARAQEAAP